MNAAPSNGYIVGTFTTGFTSSCLYDQHGEQVSVSPLQAFKIPDPEGPREELGREPTFAPSLHKPPPPSGMLHLTRPHNLERKTSRKD